MSIVLTRVREARESSDFSIISNIAVVLFDLNIVVIHEELSIFTLINPFRVIQMSIKQCRDYENKNCPKTNDTEKCTNSEINRQRKKT